MLAAIRESFSSGGYRYLFSARGIRCINGATNVVLTVGGHRHVADCRQGLTLIGRALAPHKTYDVRVQAVRMRRYRITRRGPSYSWRVSMPGDEVN
jgi:hypothetical protein